MSFPTVVTVENQARIGKKASFHFFDTFGRAIEQNQATAWLALTLLYVVAVTCLSSMKLLWLDELITLHVARLGSVGAIWQALSQGADPNPPMTHILVHFCRLVFGEHEASLRLPAIVGYWLGNSSLFLYLRRRVPGEWALTGVVAAMSMAAFDYSYESRSYGILYGFAMLAFLCWSLATDPEQTSRQKFWALLGMVLALAAGVSTNYFAVLAFLPIALGEVASTLRYITIRQRVAFSGSKLLTSVNWRVWVGLVIAASPLLVFRSMITRSIAQFAPHAWNKVSLDQVADSYTQMVEIILYPLLALFAFGVLVRWMAYACGASVGSVRPAWMRPFVRRMQSDKTLLATHEAVAVLAFMSYPILGYLVASVRGGMLSPRFVIPVCYGFAIAAALTTYRLFGHQRSAGAVLLCICLAWFIAREAVVGYWYMEQKQSFYKVLDRLPGAYAFVPHNAPIAIPDPLLALTFQHYAPPKYTDRIVFPIDFAAIRFYRHDDSPEENIWAGRSNLYTLPVVPVTFFQHAVGSYLIIASDGNWFVEDLKYHRYPVTRLPINTRAGAIGGFTPLCHGTPVFFSSRGDAIFDGVVAADLAPDPFTLPGNLPDETLSSRH